MIAAAGVLLRLAWPLGLDLYGDEAYYFLWSRRLAFGYFDHPPLVAWLVAAGALLGHAEIWVRLPFALCGGAAVWFSAAAARELSEEPSAPFLAAALGALAPLSVITSALALPDAPLTAAVACATWLLLRSKERDLPWVGALLGLALLSKYSAATLAPGLLLIAARDPGMRAALRRPPVWLGLLLALAIFAPCLWWNSQHAFVSLRFQLGHASGHGFSLAGAGAFAATELLGAGPATLVLALWWLWRTDSVPAKRLAALTFLPLIWFGYSALRGKFEANWPAFLNPALCAAAGAALASLRAPTRAAIALPATALATAALLVTAIELRHPSVISPRNVNVARFHQGSALTAAVSAHLDGRPFLFPFDYQDAGELAFYGGYTRLGPAFERPSQLDLWGDLPAPGEPFAFLGFDGTNPAIRARYRDTPEGETQRFELRFAGETVRRVSLTRFASFLGLGPRLGPQ